MTSQIEYAQLLHSLHVPVHPRWTLGVKRALVVVCVFFIFIDRVGRRRRVRQMCGQPHPVCIARCRVPAMCRC